MKRYIWSDLHFSHFNIIKYCNRPFQSAEEMDNVIIENWRKTVKPNDIIFNLGDVAMCEMKQGDKLKTLIQSLPGYKVLVLGNHDKRDINYWLDVGFSEVYKYPIIIDQWFILSHDTLFMNSNIPYINIHGHVHDKSINHKSYVNVSVEVINYTPINLDELESKIMRENN